jgi:hypothetical protein
MTGDDSPPAAEVVANSDGGPNITVLENQESLVSMNNWLEAKTLKISTTVMLSCQYVKWIWITKIERPWLVHENREAVLGPVQALVHETEHHDLFAVFSSVATS